MPVFEEVNGIQYGSGIKAVLYGQEGVGKSSLAAQIPGIVFIDCEGSTTKMNVRRLPAPTSWAMLCDEMDYIRENAAQKGYKAVAIDTFDWAESLALQAICIEHKVNGIEGLNYGKGWQYECELIGKFLNSTDKLIKAGIHVILICHAISRKTTLPEEIDEFDHWELKLGNKTTNKIAPLLKEWSDMTLFLAFKTQVMAADDKGKVHKATSVQRVMYATKSAWWDAKNRFGLPDMMPLSYGAVAHLFTPVSQDTFGRATAQQPPQNRSPEMQAGAARPVDAVMRRAQDAGIPTAVINVPDTPPQPAQQPPQAAAPSAEPLALGDLNDFETIESLGADWTGIPDALANLMKANNVLPHHIEKITGDKNEGGWGYFPPPMRNYPQDYFEWLCASWPQVMDAVRANCPDYVPF